MQRKEEKMRIKLKGIVVVLPMIIALTIAMSSASFALEGSSGAADSAEADGPDVAYSSDDIIIVYGEDATVKEQKKALKESDLEKVETVSEEGNIVRAQIDDGVSVEEAIEEAEKSEAVLYAQPNFRYSLMETTNDPGLEEQFHLSYLLVNSVSESAWSYSTGEGVKIGILDSGLNVEHTDIKDNLKGTYNAVSGGTDVSETDDELSESKAHGEHVAGIAAATGNNGFLGAGVAYDADIYFSKVCGIDGTCYCIYTSDIIKGYDWAVAQGCRVVNISIGGYGYYDDPIEGDRALENRITAAYNKSSGSVLTVCAGGNNGKTKEYCYPADFEDSYAVTAVSYNDSGTPSYWSGSDHNDRKDIAAPGVGIMSLGYLDSDGLVAMKGTSMAAPFVTGTAALMLAREPELTAKEIVEILNSTSMDVTSTEEEDGYGHGLVDPFAAVIKAKKTDISSAAATLSQTGFTYNGGAKTPSVKSIVLGDGTIVPVGMWSLRYTDLKGNSVTPRLAGTYYAVISGKGEYKGTVKKAFTIKKAANTLTAKGRTATVKYKKLKKKVQYVKGTRALTVKNARGTVRYKLVSAKKAGKKASYKKYFRVGKKTGKVRLARKMKKGTYKVRIKVTAAGTGNYLPLSKNVTVTIRVK